MGYQIIKKNNLTEIIKQLQNNQPVILPTDTVWGILCKDPNVLYRIKQRDENKKIIQFVNRDSLNDKLDTQQLSVIKKFWPGPLTVVFNGVGYRCPNDQLLLTIIKQIKMPLYCSSANLSNHPVITSLQEAQIAFQDYNENYFIYDAHDYNNKTASTILDLNNYKILRNGALDQELLSFLSKKELSF